MTKLIIDLSGREGLVDKYYGDVNDTTSKPHLRYIGSDGQFAEGIWNPLVKYGYLSPANNTYNYLSSTGLDSKIISFQYDSPNDTLYLAEEGSKIHQLDGLDDTTLTTYKTLSTGTIKDMLIYEVNESKTVIYAVDGGTPALGSYVSFEFVGDGYLPLLTKDPNVIGNDSLFVQMEDAGSASSYTATFFRKWAQSFDSDDMTSLTVGSVVLKIAENFTTDPSLTTVKVSIQGNLGSNDAPFNSRGAWSTSTSYAVDDTVTSGGFTWACIQAHTSSASNQPITGGAQEDFWTIFYGAPDESDIVSATATCDNFDDYGTLVGQDPTAYEFVFSSETTLTNNTKYWIVIEEVGTNMGASDELRLQTTASNDRNTGYPDNMCMGYNDQLSSGYWASVNPNHDYDDTAYFELRTTNGEGWTKDIANGKFDAEYNLEQFLFLSDNGLVYWFNGNQVHTIDGSAVGGIAGTVNEGVLLFPSYITVPDAAETRGRMYIGVQTSDRTDYTDKTDDSKFFNAFRAGVYVWDKRSQVTASTDYFPAPGAKEIRNIFVTATGDIAAITVNHEGFTEIRQLVGNQMGVIKTLGKEAYPPTRRGVVQLSNMSVWLGNDAIWYGYGSVEPGGVIGVFKLGSAKAITDGNTEDLGSIYLGNESTGPAIYLGYIETAAPANYLAKWHPYGEGTISSNAQVEETSQEVYTKVFQLPGLSTVRYIRGFHLPGTVNSAANVKGTVKCYINQSSTPEWTKPITETDVARGWFEKEWNKPNINFIQFSINWAGETIDTTTYRPMYLEVEYADEGRINS